MPGEMDKPSDRDTIINAAIQAIPYVGAPLAALYFGRKQERRFRRLETFYQEVAEEVRGLHGAIHDPEDHDAAELRAILEELHGHVESEQLDAKRAYYKAYFVNTMLKPVNGNFEERKLFLDTLSVLTPLQLEILALLVRKGGPVKVAAIGSPRIDSALIRGAIAQLKAYGLVNAKLDAIVFGRGGSGMDESIVVSDHGVRFHEFCVRADGADSAEPAK